MIVNSKEGYPLCNNILQNKTILFFDWEGVIISLNSLSLVFSPVGCPHSPLGKGARQDSLVVKEGYPDYHYLALGNDWYRAPTESVQHSATSGAHIGATPLARALLVIELISFGYIARLSQRRGKLVFYLFKWGRVGVSQHPVALSV